MSDSRTVEHTATPGVVSEAHPHEPSHDQPLFDNAELRGFEADDVKAGRVIGKMLSLLFIYTVVAMSIVALWTVSAIGK